MSKEWKDFNIHKYRLPNDAGDALLMYLNERIHPGGFCEALLCNDLKETYLRADNWNRRVIPDFLDWLYNEVPRNLWGSPEKVAFHLGCELEGFTVKDDDYWCRVITQWEHEHSEVTKSMFNEDDIIINSDTCIIGIDKRQSLAETIHAEMLK